MRVPPLTVILEEQPGEIRAVIIAAGAFDSGELSRPVVLKPMDIATTPSAVGDIYGALATLPGAQLVGNEGGLFVRGGEGYETKTFIDGMQVSNPYMSKLPDLPTRSRFSPLLFSGTAFSTGGFSAEYGQAPSSSGLTYMHASPKRYYNPALPFSDGDMTRAYNDLSFNITWITPLFGSYCAFMVNINNLPGFEQVYGYHYSPTPDAGGNYTLYPIIPQSKRLIVFGGYFIF